MDAPSFWFDFSTTATETDVGLGVASVALLGDGGSTRRGIILCSHPTARYTVSNRDPAVLDRGVNVPAGGAPVIIDSDQARGWLQGPLFAVASAALTTATVIAINSTVG